MSKYGGLTGPGSYRFPGWPSKVHGAASGDGRHNALPEQGIILGNGFGQKFPKGLPRRNEIVDGRWLLPNYLRISTKGSKVAKTLLFTFPESRGMRHADFFGLTAECYHEPTREWLNGGFIFFPFELIYFIAKADEPGAMYDQLIHFNGAMPYVTSRPTSMEYSGTLFHWLPGAPASSSPDPRIIDENLVVGGKPTLDTCRISVEGSNNLRAIFFVHWDAGDAVYVVENNGAVYGYPAYEMPFFLIQLMAYSDKPGAICEQYIHRKFPMSSSMNILPKNIRERYPGVWP